MTNLFSNHDDYRGVARLWYEWSRAAPRTPSPGELHKQRQELHRSFDAWCMLVIVRACSQLGLAPAEDKDWESEIHPGSAIRLDKGLRLDWERTGAITLVDNDRVLVRFVPLIHVLEQAKTREAVMARGTPLVEAVPGKTHWTIVLHPAISGRPPHDALAGVQSTRSDDDRRHRLHTGFAVLPRQCRAGLPSDPVGDTRPPDARVPSDLDLADPPGSGTGP